MGRGGVSPSHFFYDMTFAEVNAFLRGLDKREKATWEKVRLLCGALGREINFPWDKSEPVEVDEKEIERIKELAKNFEL